MANSRDIKTDYLQELLKMDIPVLSDEDQRELGKRIQEGDQAALDKLVVSNLRLVITILTKLPAWEHSKLEQEDLISVGNLQLILAAKSWDPTGPYMFSTHARQCIVRGIAREIDLHSNTIRLPGNVMQEIKKVHYQIRVLSQSLGRLPKAKELAKALDMPVSRIHELKSILSREPISLDNLNQDNNLEEIEQ